MHIYIDAHQYHFMGVFLGLSWFYVHLLGFACVENQEGSVGLAILTSDGRNVHRCLREKETIVNKVKYTTR